MNDTNDPMEAYIRRGLKNWAAQQHPPDTGRARLLLVAASPSAQQVQTSTSDPRENASSTALRPSSSDDVFQSQNQTWFWVLHTTLTPARHLP